jgi:hypothetical protein
VNHDQVLEFVRQFLENQGWKIIEIHFGREPGRDLVADKSHDRWVIEAKGGDYKRRAAFFNQFDQGLGALLGAFDRDGKYGIALPDIEVYRNLWGQIPALAKQRLNLCALFVGENGNVIMVP